VAGAAAAGADGFPLDAGDEFPAAGEPAGGAGVPRRHDRNPTAASITIGATELKNTDFMNESS
jgi:hypothetical protein